MKHESCKHHVIGYDLKYILILMMYACSTHSHVTTFAPTYINTISICHNKQNGITTPVRMNALQPETNPYANPNTLSVSGVKYEHVYHGLMTLYPSHTLDQRNAISRTDAYWPYIQKGFDPPTELTYGEFDFYFFAQLLDRAIALSDETTNNGQNDTTKNSIHSSESSPKIFCDIGSGTGRLVLAAATLHPQLFQFCRGVELLPNLHQAAIDILHQCRGHNNNNDDNNDDNATSRNPQLPSPATTTTTTTTTTQILSPIGTTHALTFRDNDDHLVSYPMAPILLDCGSFDDPYNIYYGDADIIFIFSSCMGSDLVQNKLVQALGRQCQIGTIIITTDYMLPLQGYIPPNENDSRIPHGNYQLKLLESIDGWCWLTGGASTAYIHRVEISLQQPGKIEPLELSLQDKALAVVHALESGTLSDYKVFIRNVRNNMIFNGFPEYFLPKLPESE
jgi:hypothetical protein